jgi:ADP-heptose:LPS heptosyltransferase
MFMKRRIVTAVTGGIGDFLVAIPTYKALHERSPSSKIILFGTNKSVVDLAKSIPYIYSARLLEFWSLAKSPILFYTFYFNRKFIEYYHFDFQRIPLSWGYNKSVKEIIPEVCDIELRNSTIELFFTEKQERKALDSLAPYKNIVIMHIQSRSSKNHHWPIENWIELVKLLPQYTFIQLGNIDEPYVAGAVDWRGKTTLVEAFCLLKYSTSFVGIDSSFAHATNAFDIPGVVLFGDSNPIHWGHPNNINIFKDLPCCCYYELRGGPCPYGNACMHLITIDEVKNALIKQVNSKRK